MTEVPVTGGIMEETGTDQILVEEWSKYDAEFHQDFLTRYGRTGYGYDYYQPAYRYGYDLVNNPHYQGYDWSRLEPIARQQYEGSEAEPTRQADVRKAAWADVRDAVQHAWGAVTGR